MKRGKDLRDPTGVPVDPSAAKVPALIFSMVEKSLGAFVLRFVSNDDLLEDLRTEGTLETFLNDADQLYADFRKRFVGPTSERAPTDLAGPESRQNLLRLQRTANLRCA